LTVYNDSPFTETVDVGLITFNVPAEWEVTAVPSDTLELGPFSEGVISVTVRIPCAVGLESSISAQQIFQLQQEAGGLPTIDVEGYINSELVGGIELQFEGSMEVPSPLYLPMIVKSQAPLPG
jgi:hypothetical protein